MKGDIIVFDLETKKEFAEIKNREDVHLLGVSVLCAYSYNSGKFFAFEEKDLKHFEKMIDGVDKLIGFNIKSFDLPVLQPYLSVNLSSVPSLDMMDDVVLGAGFRISLDNLCQATINSQKSAHGLDAIKWYREGKLEEIKKYCTDDVRLTRDLYEFGKKSGYVKYFSRDLMDKVSIPVSWGGEVAPNVRQVLDEGLKKRQSVEIDYVTRSSEAANSARNTRLVDIHKIGSDIFEGYCHLRGGLRIFKIDRVFSAKLTKNPYKLESDMQNKLL